LVSLPALDNFFAFDLNKDGVISLEEAMMTTDKRILRKIMLTTMALFNPHSLILLSISKQLNIIKHRVDAFKNFIFFVWCHTFTLTRNM